VGEDQENMPSAMLDQLSEHLVKFAQGLLDAHGEFRPFGATVDGDGQLQYYAADNGSERGGFPAQIEILQRALREASESDQIHAAGFCFDVLLHHEDRPKQDAIQCILEHADGEAIERFTPYSKTEDGAVRYGEGFTNDGSRKIFGFAGSALTLENQAPIYSPTLRQLAAAIDSLTPQGGPGFLILEGPTQDYSQAAGGDGKFTAEWREYLNGEFTHWVIGWVGEGTEEDVEIETNGCVVTVRKNEVLTGEDVKTVLGAFARGKGKPSEFLWRDMTRRFAEAKPEGDQG
jgi:hypothetical protein